LDAVDIYEMWRHLYLFRSYDLHTSGKYIPSFTREHNEWVIPPTVIDSVYIEYMFNTMDNYYINA